MQLQGRTKIEPWVLWWLYHDDVLTIREHGRACDVPLRILVHVNASFRVQDLVQPFLRTWRPWFRTYGEQRARPSRADYDHETEGETVHPVIILRADDLSRALKRWVVLQRGPHRSEILK